MCMHSVVKSLWCLIGSFCVSTKSVVLETYYIKNHTSLLGMYLFSVFLTWYYNIWLTCKYFIGRIFKILLYSDEKKILTYMYVYVYIYSETFLNWTPSRLKKKNESNSTWEARFIKVNELKYTEVELF